MGGGGGGGRRFRAGRGPRMRVIADVPFRVVAVLPGPGGFRLLRRRVFPSPGRGCPAPRDRGLPGSGVPGPELGRSCVGCLQAGRGCSASGGLAVRGRVFPGPGWSYPASDALKPGRGWPVIACSLLPAPGPALPEPSDLSPPHASPDMRSPLTPGGAGTGAFGRSQQTFPPDGRCSSDAGRPPYLGPEAPAPPGRGTSGHSRLRAPLLSRRCVLPPPWPRCPGLLGWGNLRHSVFGSPAFPALCVPFSRASALRSLRGAISATLASAASALPALCVPFSSVMVSLFLWGRRSQPLSLWEPLLLRWCASSSPGLDAPLPLAWVPAPSRWGDLSLSGV